MRKLWLVLLLIACVPEETPEPEVMEEVEDTIVVDTVAFYFDGVRVDDGTGHLRIRSIEDYDGVRFKDGYVIIGVGQKFDMNLLCVKRRIPQTNNWVAVAGTCDGVQLRRITRG